jgi:fluoroquinolone transport system permease protein
MNALGLLRTLGPVDLRNVRRDPLMAWALGMPFSVALVFRWGIPPLADWLARSYGFDLTPYYPLLVSGYFLVAPAFIGFVVGFLLLDERDDGVLDAMRVTPVPIRSLLAYRIGVPLVAGLVVTLAGYGLVGLVTLPPLALLTATLLAAFSAPIQALFLVAFAENKVSGFAMMKLFSAVTDLPIVAWFVAMPWQLAAGVIPSYWPMKVVWQAADGAPWAAYAVVGLVVNGLAVVVLLRRFQRVLAR